MILSNYLAQDIVEEMKLIINQEINYFDANGYIIASTDKDRIGSFHEGAMGVLRSGNEVVIDYDGEYQGAKKGINLPVYWGSEIVGVIGITGSKEDVEKYGRIIKRITEILIKDAYIREEKMLLKESKRQFVEELLFRYKSDESLLRNWAEILNFKINLRRFIFIIKIKDFDMEDIGHTISNLLEDKLYKHLEDYLSYDIQNIVFKSGSNIVIIYRLHDSNNIDDIILDILNSVDKLEKKVKVNIGVGSIINNIFDIKKSYNEALEALQLSWIDSKKTYTEYKYLDIGLLLRDIKNISIDAYLNRVFGDLSEQQRKEYIEVLSVYIENDGAITSAADDLYIHKNTLQYRLNKLEKITGYNPRNIKDMAVLYLALVLENHKSK